jgi:hypothetical protein
MKKGEIICEYYTTPEPISKDLKIDGKPLPQIAVKRVEGYVGNLSG